MQDNFNKHFFPIQTLFSDHGIKNMTMDDIARSLHISKKTIYKYYSCKDELVGDIYVNDYYQFKVTLHLLERENIDAISKTIKLYNILLWKVFSIKNHVLFDLEKYYPYLLNEIIDLHRESIKKTFIEIFMDGRANNFFNNEINPHSVAYLFTYLFESYVSDQMFEPKGEYIISWYDIIDYHFRSICNPIGLRKWEDLRTQNLVSCIQTEPQIEFP